MNTITVAPESAVEQRQLLVLNRCVPDLDDFARIASIEQDWIVPLMRRIETDVPRLDTHADFVDALRKRLSDEEDNPGPSDHFLAVEATREQFAVVVRSFAVDGLIEAQSFFPILPRLPHRSQMAVLRVVIDEFGCGNLEQSHSQLYRHLLAELGDSVEFDDHLDDAPAQVLSFVNIFHWMASRAPVEEYFLGALAYLEASILYAFRSFAAGCDRLGIRGGKYYTEHLHIDNFHEKEMRTAIRELGAVRTVDYRKVWAGVELASASITEAVDAAVARAKAGT